MREDASRKRHSDQQVETIYRDAAGNMFKKLALISIYIIIGKKIDVKLAKIEAERLKQAKDAAEASHLEWGKGKIQTQAKNSYKDALEEVRKEPFARSQDDPKLNTELRRTMLWDDPMKEQIIVKRYYLLMLLCALLFCF
jgi:Pre-mRNA-splicing factor of RES complex